MLVRIAFALLFPIFINFIHFVATRFYSSYCVEEGIIGFLKSILTTTSPVCSLTLKVMSQTSDIYFQCWLSVFTLVSTFLSELLCKVFQKRNEEVSNK